jgi:hypothetical protein
VRDGKVRKVTPQDRQVEEARPEERLKAQWQRERSAHSMAERAARFADQFRASAEVPQPLVSYNLSRVNVLLALAGNRRRSVHFNHDPAAEQGQGISERADGGRAVDACCVIHRKGEEPCQADGAALFGTATAVATATHETQAKVIKRAERERPLAVAGGGGVDKDLPAKSDSAPNIVRGRRNRTRWYITANGSADSVIFSTLKCVRIGVG